MTKQETFTVWIRRDQRCLDNVSRRLDKIENLKQRFLETKYRILLRSIELLQGGYYRKVYKMPRLVYNRISQIFLVPTMGQAHVMERASRASG